MCVCFFLGWQGLDCSLAQPPSAAAQSDAPARKYAPMYVYPLPTDYSLEAVYQRDQLDMRRTCSRLLGAWPRPGPQLGFRSL